MKDANRIRRTALLCLHCIANVACYRAGWAYENQPPRLRVAGDFWVRANGNFLDIAILEWCKLFADRGGKHHWTRIFKDKASFRADLFANLQTTETEFTTQLLTIKRYRDKFVAHLDEDAVAQIPRLDLLQASAAHLYTLLCAIAQADGHLVDAPTNVAHFYQHAYERALVEYSAA